jgi:hypothetical protein
MGIDTLMLHLLGVPVWGGGASAPEGADVLCPHHLDILGEGGGTHMTHVTEECLGGEDMGHRRLREPMPKKVGHGRP